MAVVAYVVADGAGLQGGRALRILLEANTGPDLLML
jgi:hypothetical protein